MAKSGKATIYDVARVADVSVRTVSRCLKDSGKVAEATAERVRQAVVELGYRPNVYANRVSRQAQHVLAVMLWYESDEALRNLHRLLLGYTSRNLCSRGRDLILIGADEANADRVIDESIRQEKFDSLLLLNEPCARILEALAEAPFPKVTLNWPQQETLPMRHHTYIGIRYFESSRLYTRLLLERGCRKILYLAPYPCERLEGAKAAVAEWGEGAEIVWRECGDRADCMPDALPIMEELAAAQSRPDALYCFSDAIALCMLSCAQECGLRVPSDLRIVGFDGFEGIRYCRPRLTTMAQPWEAMSNRAVEWLLDADRNEVLAGGSIHLDTEMWWGESC